ncbi:MAG: DegV family protein [Anaerolineae bacterium]
MGNIRIVTDSSAQFLNPDVLARYGIHVVPHRVRFGHEVLREGVDLDADGFFRRILTDGAPMPVLEGPSVEAYITVLNDLAQETDSILVLPMASGMGVSYANARAAAETVRGRCDVVVLDSMTASVGLAFLAETAARAAQSGASLEGVVRQVRSAIPRVYAVFYVETLDYLFRAHLIGEAQSILGKILGIKPFLTIEDGRLVTMEKVRTRVQAVDKLLEYVLEFSEIEQLVIVQNTPHVTDQTRLIIERLTLEFGRRDYPVMMYGASLGTFLGPDGVGIVIYEAEEED